MKSTRLRFRRTRGQTYWPAKLTLFRRGSERLQLLSGYILGEGRERAPETDIDTPRGSLERPQALKEASQHLPDTQGKYRKIAAFVAFLWINIEGGVFQTGTTLQPKQKPLKSSFDLFTSESFQHCRLISNQVTSIGWNYILFTVTLRPVS